MDNEKIQAVKDHVSRHPVLYSIIGGATIAGITYVIMRGVAHNTLAL